MFALLLASFTLATAAIGQDETIDTIRTDASDPTDKEIEERLTEIFAEVEGLDAVTVESEAGVITLGGQVLRSELTDEAELLANSVEGVVTVQNEIKRDTRFRQQIQPLIDKLSSTAESFVASLPIVLLAAAVVGAFWWFGGWVSRSIYIPQSLAPNLFVDELVRLIVRLVLALVGFLVAAELLGATALLVSILGGLGVVGLALGFAIRDTVENFVASVLLSIRQPFDVNEHVVVDGSEGRIMRLTARATIMLDLDGNHVRIPNSVVYKSTIVNYSRNPMRRFRFDVGIDTDVNPPLAQELAVETLSAIDGVLSDPPPLCIVHALGDSNVVLRIFAWVDQDVADFTKTRSASMAVVKQAFEAADINMPEPIYRLRVENVDASKSINTVAADKRDPPIDYVHSSDLRPDTSIDEQVARHRDGDDLLSKNAPRE